MFNSQKYIDYLNQNVRPLLIHRLTQAIITKQKPEIDSWLTQLRNEVDANVVKHLEEYIDDCVIKEFDIINNEYLSMSSTDLTTDSDSTEEDNKLYIQD